MQNMLRDIKNKADKAGKLGFHIEESMWQATARTYSDQQSSEVSAVMKSLYSAFNRKNYDELRALWLPDESVEMTFPGFEKAVSFLLFHRVTRIDKLNFLIFSFFQMI